MRHSNMILFAVPLLLTTACRAPVVDQADESDGIGTAAQAVVQAPATTETPVTENGTDYLKIRAGYCHGDGVVVRDSRIIRLGQDTGITDATGITTFLDPSRNDGERVCHNKSRWLKLAAYVCQYNDQYVNPSDSRTGTYVGEAVEDWQLTNWVSQTELDPLREFFPAPAGLLPYSFIDHPDKDVTTGLNLALMLLNAEPCPTPSGNDFLLERVECCMDAPRPVQ